VAPKQITLPFARSFREIKSKLTGKPIGYPVIGAGVAGGDWNVISQIITEELAAENHTLVKYRA